MPRTLTYLLLTLASVFWGVSFIMTKELFISEPHITVTIIITFRLLLASLVMIPSLLMMKKMEPLRKGDLKWFLLLALAEPFIYSLCETSGVQLVSGSLASVVIATIPLFVPFGLAAVFHEKLKASTLIGVVLSFIGIGVMIIGGESLTGSARGLFFLSGAVVIAVVYTLFLVKVVDHYRPVTITTYQNLFGFIYFLPLMLITDGSQLPMLSYSPKMILLLLALGILCSTIAYVFYNYGIRDLGASAACIFTNTIPIFSLIAAVLIGQELFTWPKLIGMLIVIAGVIFAQRRT